jgi:hypothetical protein
VEGSSLELQKISRLDMGVYLCIASNGVPPTVSKRIYVSVDCESHISHLSLLLFAQTFNLHYRIALSLLSLSISRLSMLTLC